MNPSYHTDGYFYYVCPKCGGKRGFKMTLFNKFKDLLRSKEKREG